MAYSLAGSVLAKLASVAWEEISLVWGMRDDLEKLGRDVSAIRAVLLDAEERQAQNPRLSIWLEDLKDVLLDAVQVIDEVECEALRRKAVKTEGNIRRKVRRFCSPHSNPLTFRVSMAHKIKKIKKRLAEVAARKNDFNLAERTHENPRTRGRASMNRSLFHPSEVIGRESDKTRIIELLREEDDDRNVSVIPLCGIGGVGKTTLAKFVFNDEDVRHHFDFKMWVCVSEYFDVPKLIKAILDYVNPGINENCSLDELGERLRNVLEGGRYLLVLDDVWNESVDEWFELRKLLVNGKKGSKIMVTTRKDAVASLMGTAPTYNVGGLSMENCLSLFFKWAFDKQDECPQNLQDIGREIVEKCKGVPLAVRTLGSLLHKQLDTQAWKDVRDSAFWELPQDDCHILPALQLSYNDLPSHLKRCFVFCSLFPKDQEIYSYDLLQLWMAHDVIQSPDGRRSLEATGEMYFKELCSRSFFQDVVEHSWFYTFYMHDLIHDLAQSVAQHECLLLTPATKTISRPKVRHLSIACSGDEIASCLDKLTAVQTIMFPVPRMMVSQMESMMVQLSSSYRRKMDQRRKEHLKNAPGTFFIENHVSKFKLLRVLNITYSSLEVLPSYISGLKYLRCLNLTNNGELKKLSNSICKLQSLQTLRFGGCSKLEQLPRDIGNLISLRLLSVTTKQTLFPDQGIERLTSLRSLTIQHCHNLISLPKGLRCLAALETLVIGNCGKLLWDDDDEDIQEMELSLRTLVLLHLPEVVSLPRWLQGCANTLQRVDISWCPQITEPVWLPNVKSLEEIEIIGCYNIPSDLPEKLNHIRSLRRVTVRPE